MSESKTRVEELRLKQYEAELASRERLTKAAETEIARVWTAYTNTLKLAALVLVIGGVIISFLGWQRWSDLRENAATVALKAVNAELERQFATTNIQQMITDKAKERIDVTAEPIVKTLFTNWEATASKKMVEIDKQVTITLQKTAELETKLVSFDPLKQPLRSASATVRFEVISGVEITNKVMRSRASLFFMKQGDWKRWGVLNFVSTRTDLALNGFWNIDFSCEIVSGSSFVTYLGTTTTAEELFNGPSGFRLYVDFLAGGFQLTNGFVALTLNGVTKRFDIPSQTNAANYLFITDLNNGGPTTDKPLPWYDTDGRLKQGEKIIDYHWTAPVW